MKCKCKGVSGALRGYVKEGLDCEEKCRGGLEGALRIPARTRLRQPPSAFAFRPSSSQTIGGHNFYTYIKFIIKYGSFCILSKINQFETHK